MQHERENLSASAGTGKGRSPLRILLADDDEGCLESVRSVLHLDGHQIFTATRGLEAVEWVRRLKGEHAPLDLSILDFNMPDITGVETFQRIVIEMPGVRGIFISGEVTASLEELVLRVGGQALLRKPLDVLRIRSAIRSVGGSGFAGNLPFEPPFEPPFGKSGDSNFQKSPADGTRPGQASKFKES